MHPLSTTDYEGYIQRRMPDEPTPPTIHVTGEAYTALFHVPPGLIFLKGADDVREARVHAMPVGVDYLRRAIRAVCYPQPLLDERVSEWPTYAKLTWCSDPKLHPAPDGSRPRSLRMPLYEIIKVEEVADFKSTEKLPRLRLASASPQRMTLSAVTATTASVEVGGEPPDRVDVLVYWFGRMPPVAQPPESPTPGKPIEAVEPAQPAQKPVKCSFHIQVGLAKPLGTKAPSHDDVRRLPHEFAKPEVGRLLVVNIGELSDQYRIRCSLSYEAVAVDLLRLLRGDLSRAAPTPLLKELSMDGDGAASLSVLAVRLSNAAVFVYACAHRERAGGPQSEATQTKATATPRASSPGGSGSPHKKEFVEIGAWLLCHKSECAPLSEPELGQMIGCTGFVSAQLAAGLACWFRNLHDSALADNQLQDAFCEVVRKSVRRSLIWQHAAYERGLLHMLLKKEGTTWVPTSADARDENDKIGYEHLFVEIITAILKEFGEKTEDLSGCPALHERIANFDDCFQDEVLCVRVEIARAVAHRTQWFMARSVAKEWSTSTSGAAGNGPNKGMDDTDFAEVFLEIATGWLSSGEDGRAKVPDLHPAVPIVRIGDAELTDRREVEDYLAIYQALRVYATSRQDKTPLNIAVFGAPGAGKSTAVKQVVKHLCVTHEGVFRREPLTFNLGQFKSLDDLPAALHLVRNECLSSEIPIVFFDEFDSSFNGQPFGWLKFFLAPMQDGDFYHAGQTYKMGRAIFVFAGAVNRSFEEFNGRVRNPGFCEAKGPDFISRLKSHLNVQGINKPEGDTDQSRYILRRGILLRGILRQKLQIKPEQRDAPLLHPNVARALLRVDRFKHGVRSLEAIIRMCATRPGHAIGPSDLPSMNQLEMHVDAAKFLEIVDNLQQLKKENEASGPGGGGRQE